MPSYKTHSIHGELILPEIDKKVDINKDDLKAFCSGPDALIATNSQIFYLQHRYNTKSFFLNLIHIIKERKLYENSEVMAFLYGHLAHYALDIVTHPLIYYMTEGIPKDHKLDYHGLVEHYLDDYVMQEFNIGNGACYHKVGIKDSELIKTVTEVYQRAYNAKSVGLQYSGGIAATRFYDSVLRRCTLLDPIIALINLGDIKYHNDFELARPYLNLEHDVWFNPETGEKNTDSFLDLFNKAREVALDMIDDVNKFIYGDKPLENYFILNDISYNTGLPCDKGQTKTFIKSYK